MLDGVRYRHVLALTKAEKKRQKRAKHMARQQTEADAIRIARQTLGLAHA
jgi:DNA-binding XRE family transcriptional regulator